MLCHEYAYGACRDIISMQLEFQVQYLWQIGNSQAHTRVHSCTADEGFQLEGALIYLAGDCVLIQNLLAGYKRTPPWFSGRSPDCSSYGRMP